MLLRIGMDGIPRLWGAKIFPNISPLEDLATRTTVALTFGQATGH
jgi:hypothetical protein